MVDSRFQINSNLGFIQTGSADASEAGIVLGATNSSPVFIGWQDIRDSLMQGASSRVSYFDDFLGKAIASRWGTDLSVISTFEIVSGQENGVARLQNDPDDNDHATLSLNLNFGVSNGSLYFKTRCYVYANSVLLSAEIGLASVVASGNGWLVTNHSSISTSVEMGANAVFFGYDTDHSMTNWYAISIYGGSPSAVSDTGVAVEDGWNEFEIIVESNGSASYFINGVLVKYRENAIDNSTKLTPIINVKNLGISASSKIDVDYIMVSAVRD